jgi:hypothetical protein
VPQAANLRPPHSRPIYSTVLRRPRGGDTRRRRNTASEIRLCDRGPRTIAQPEQARADRISAASIVSENRSTLSRRACIGAHKSKNRSRRRHWFGARKIRVSSTAGGTRCSSSMSGKRQAQRCDSLSGVFEIGTTPMPAMGNFRRRDDVWIGRSSCGCCETDRPPCRPIRGHPRLRRGKTAECGAHLAFGSPNGTGIKLVYKTKACGETAITIECYLCNTRSKTARLGRF